MGPWSKFVKKLKFILRFRILDEFVIWKNNRISKKNSPIVDLPSHTINSNKYMWDNYDWVERGENWTFDVQKLKKIDPTQWKSELVNKMMLKYLKKDTDILEIGPGAGRWSEVLQPFAKKLILVDISKKCITICQTRFKAFDNVEYHLIDGRLNMIKDNSIDFIWSYDVFVHINPTDIRNYMQDFERILRPGGCAIIHHTGIYPDSSARLEGFRTFMDKYTFEQLVKENRMTIIEQNDSLPHRPGDVISVFSKITDKNRL